MKRIQISSVAWLVFVGLVFPLQAPAQQPADAAKSTIKTSSDEVVLDVVVRDKKGKELRDLAAEDLEVTDNGVKQSIKSFRRVEGAEAIAKGSTQKLDPLRQIRLVTLVFEGLGPTNRQYARKAALDLINGSQAQNLFYAVMTIDTQLSVVQTFTADRQLLKKAVDRATSGSFTEFIADTERIRGELQKQLASAPDGRSVEEKAQDLQGAQVAPNAQGAVDPSGAVAAKVAQIMLNMIRTTETYSRDSAARASIFSLMAMIRGQASLPGRKTILHFSEGLRIPTNLDDAFANLKSRANRANVSFYTIDARGVGAAGTGGASSDLAGAANSSRRQQTNPDAAVTPDQVLSADRAEEGMRGDAQSKLRDLAESTGGFLISDTNDLRAPLRRVNEEINSYYEVSYNPGIDTYDGRFHKTSVRLLRGDAKVSTRNGYFALPAAEEGNSLSASDIPAYQVPLLKSLGMSPLPRAVDYKSSAMHFHQTPEGVQSALVIEVPLRSLEFAEDKVKNTYSAHVSVVALIKNSKGEVLKRFGKDLPLQGPLDKLGAVRQANFSYKENFSLAPGRYTVETAVLDQEAVKVGAKRVSFVVASRPSGVGISSLSVVRRFEPNAKDMDADEPFQLQGGRITPSLAATVPGVKGSMLSIFFVVFPDPKIAEKPQATVEYLLDGKSVGRGAVDLPAADAKGRIAYVMSSPADAMKPGTYEVHAVVKQGATAAEDRTFVTIEQPTVQ